MPLHSLTALPNGAWLGRWHLTERPANLWPQLPAEAAGVYAPLLPARPSGLRQAQWLAGRLLLPRLLAAAGWAVPHPYLLNEANGRPYLAGLPPRGGPAPVVSLSHSGQWVTALLAPPGTAAGLDVELVRDKAQRLASKFLNADELAAVGAGAPDELYTLLWSAKETLFKLAGRPGIIFRDNLLLDLPPGSATLAARLRLGPATTRHQIHYLRPAAGYVLTYCVAPQPFSA